MIGTIGKRLCLCTDTAYFVDFLTDDGVEVPRCSTAKLERPNVGFVKVEVVRTALSNS